MDREIKRRSFVYRHRYYLLAGVFVVVICIVVGVRAAGGVRQRVRSEAITIAEVERGTFSEYVDAECTVVPSLVIKVNTREGGFVSRIVAEDGSMVRQGDTILVLENSQLVDELADEKNSYESKLLTFREKELALQKSTLTLRQNIMQAEYDLANLESSFRLEQEEFKMGIISPVQLENARNEYEFQKRKAALQLEMLRGDSVSSVLSRELFENDIERERRRYQRSMERLGDLVVRAPISGQLSSVQATPGQQVNANASVAEIKVLDPFKLQTTVSERYIDRIVAGHPATALDQGHSYPLSVTRALPEITDRMFRIELAFTGQQPDNVRIGKSYRAQIELDRSEGSVVVARGDFFAVTGGVWIYKLVPGSDRAVKTLITIGRQNPRYYEVLSGLDAGDRVVVGGYGQLQAGADELIIE